jgi:hypothetical protein
VEVHLDRKGHQPTDQGCGASRFGVGCHVQGWISYSEHWQLYILERVWDMVVWAGIWGGCGESVVNKTLLLGNACLLNTTTERPRGTGPVHLEWYLRSSEDDAALWENNEQRGSLTVKFERARNEENKECKNARLENCKYLAAGGRLRGKNPAASDQGVHSHSHVAFLRDLKFPSPSMAASCSNSTTQLP